jgi:hypothetical protein
MLAQIILTKMRCDKFRVNQQDIKHPLSIFQKNQAQNPKTFYKTIKPNFTIFTP